MDEETHIPIDPVVETDEAQPLRDRLEERRVEEKPLYDALATGQPTRDIETIQKEQAAVDADRLDSAAPQADTYRPDLVHLPAVIANEVGMSRSEARMAMVLGTTEVDGQMLSRNVFDVPREGLEGKTIVLRSDTHNVVLTYREDREEYPSGY